MGTVQWAQCKDGGCRGNCSKRPWLVTVAGAVAESTVFDCRRGPNRQFAGGVEVRAIRDRSAK